jgi:BirA family biotin operon repressor/biotin-[acetyl-CoA-carboxylase] ligase
VIGTPRVHHRATDSTNLRARELAMAGAPHGTLVTAGEQSPGRGRQGRTWSAPPGRALLMSLVLRDPPECCPLDRAVAVAEVCGRPRRDQVAQRRPARRAQGRGHPRRGPPAGGLGGARHRPQRRPCGRTDLPEELRDRATGLEREPDEVETVLADLLAALDRRLPSPRGDARRLARARRAARREITWTGGTGVAAGVDERGRLLVDVAGGERLALDAGEVHLGRLSP